MHSPSDRHNPAFPVVQKCGHDNPVLNGMSLRDYFAAKALSTLDSVVLEWSDQGVAECCYKIADAMLEARK